MTNTDGRRPTEKQAETQVYPWASCIYWQRQSALWIHLSRRHVLGRLGICARWLGAATWIGTRYFVIWVSSELTRVEFLLYYTYLFSSVKVVVGVSAGSDVSLPCLTGQDQGLRRTELCEGAIGRKSRHVAVTSTNPMLTGQCSLLTV